MESTHVDGNRNNNGKMEDEFDNCTDNKVPIFETVICGGFINEEVYDTHNKQKSLPNYVSIKNECINDQTVGLFNEEPCSMEYNQGINYVRIKDENIDDLTVIVIPETEELNCIDDEIYLNENVTKGGYIKQEPCGMKDQQGNSQNYLKIKEEDVGDVAVVPQETELMTDCIDNKLCVYETVIREGYIKEEPCDIKEESGSIHSNINMIGCEECGEKYDLYCLKCPMLNRIFDSNTPDGTDNTIRRTLPKKIIDIHDTPSGVVTVALRAIPKGVVFGPFEGLDSTKDEVISKLKLTNKELVPTKDPKRLNWMQYVRRADTSFHQNLVPFQYQDRLYYQSECHINVGDELLVYWGSDSRGSESHDMEDNYWEPQICESLDDSYACTFCCVGYKSISHLKAHNSTCIEKRNKNDFCEEIVQCNTCKIYLDKKEYSDHHTNRCYKSDGKCLLNSGYRMKCGRPLRYRIHNGERPFSCTLCPYKAATKSHLKQHIAIHNDEKPFACTLCPYKTTRESNLKQHTIVHNEDRPFACTLCPYKATRKSHLKEHIAVHNDDKPFACTLCPYKTTTEYILKRHIAVHNDDKPFACTVCLYKTTRESNLKRHIAVHNGDKPFVCTLCPYKTTTKYILKRHFTTHSDDKPFGCTLCPYKSARKSHLKQHIVAHNDGKPYACIHCPYKSARKSHLKQHIVVHTGDKPFACTLCTYKTARESNLKQHIIVHNDDRPFACTICPYKTARKSRLKQHIAAHNGGDIK